MAMWHAALEKHSRAFIAGLVSDELWRELEVSFVRAGTDPAEFRRWLTSSSHSTCLTEESWRALCDIAFGSSGKMTSGRFRTVLWYAVIWNATITYPIDESQEYLPECLGELSHAVVELEECASTLACLVALQTVSTVRKEEFGLIRETPFFEMAQLLLAAAYCGMVARDLPERVEATPRISVAQTSRGWLLELNPVTWHDGASAWNDAFGLVLGPGSGTLSYIDRILALWIQTHKQ